LIRIFENIINDGELSGKTIILRIGGRICEDSGITIRVPPAWVYSSCLEAISSDILDTNRRRQSNLSEMLVGLIGAKITLFEINPTNVILECGSIRIKKELTNYENSFQVEDHDQRVRHRISNETCVEEAL
jgi:hypothetical protein